MTESIKFEDGRELVLSNRVAWLMEYRDQFGRDILPSLMPVMLSISDMLAGLVEEGVDLEKLKINDVEKLFGSYSMTEAMVKLSALEVTDYLNIVWALNKAADETISEPKEWIRQFEEFPFDKVTPVVIKLVVKGVMTSKNSERLMEVITKLKSAETKTKKTKNH